MDWASVIDPGLALTVVDAGDGLFGFAHFQPRLRAQLGLVRAGVDGPGPEAVEEVVAELHRSGRVIVAGDGFRLPWHVAHGRQHVPHWYVLAGAPDRLEVVDPFACRNELGVQEATRASIAGEDLAELLVGLPGGDPVLELRERLALGDDCGPPGGSQLPVVRARRGRRLTCAGGGRGPGRGSTLAAHFREHGQDPGAYAQADDIWSIGRHRAFLARHAAAVAARTADEALGLWVRSMVRRSPSGGATWLL